MIVWVCLVLFGLGECCYCCLILIAAYFSICLGELLLA